MTIDLIYNAGVLMTGANLRVDSTVPPEAAMYHGVLLINLGTPETLTRASVRRYLKEFLSDPRVVDLPRVLRELLVRGLILPFRPRRILPAYQAIWMSEGSPLRVYSERLVEKVQQALAINSGNASSLSLRYTVALAMRYGSPRIDVALKELLAAGCQRITVLPLFPQYSSAATGSVMEAVMNVLRQQWNIVPLTIVPPFFNHPAFIEAYATVIQSCVFDSEPEHWIFSYHGLPVRHIEKSGCLNYSHCQDQGGCQAATMLQATRRSQAAPQAMNDQTKGPQCTASRVTAPSEAYCYRAQCYETTTRLARRLHLSTAQYSVAFQSRLGRTPWIKPYLDHLLPRLRAQGIERIAVVCPSFVADCLETLEEVAIRAKAQWIALGGQSLQVVPCLNDHPAWVNAVLELLETK